MVDVLLTNAVFGNLVDDLWPRGVHSVADYLQAQGGALARGRGPRPDVPVVLREALGRSSLLHLRYLSDRGEETERLVRPISVSDHGGNLSLVAHCYLRDALRTFRLDRILVMEPVRGYD